MALVVLLRGVNVGGHKTFRPTALVRALAHLDPVSIGAAGTFVVRRKVSVAQLRDEVARRLPFEAEIVICQGRDVLGLLDANPFEGEPERPDMVRFVSTLAQQPRAAPAMPIVFPERGPWLLKLLARQDRFVCGVYRRQMRAIDYLGRVDRVFGVPVTTRNWNTMTAIGRALGRTSGS